MSDNDLIRRGDAVLAVTAADKERLGANGARDFIRAVPAVQVGVKPMEWLEIRHGQYFEARVIGILYSVRLGTDGIARWQAGHIGTWHDAPTIEAAKAAALADYGARIRSALTAQPSPDVAALVNLLEGWLAISENCEITSGVCCCGDDMDYHAEPMFCGHVSTDNGAYIARDHASATRAALARVKGGEA